MTLILNYLYLESICKMAIKDTEKAHIFVEYIWTDSILIAKR